MSEKSKDLLSWFEKRKGEVVAGGLSTHVLAVYDCSTELTAMVKAMVVGDHDVALKCAERVYVNEKSADNQEEELCRQLSIGDASPRERNDMLTLVHGVDSIADWCKEAAMSVQIIIETGMDVPVAIWEDLLEMARNLEVEIRQFMNSLRIFESGDYDSISTCLRSVMDQERIIDQATYDFTKKLYLSDLNDRTVFVLKNLVDEFETAADTCKGCSDNVRILVVSRM